MHRAGVSVRGQTISELSLDDPDDALDFEAPGPISRSQRRLSPDVRFGLNGRRSSYLAAAGTTHFGAGPLPGTGRPAHGERGRDRRAFRKLAKQHHPDKNPGDKPAEERFKRVSAAFDLLGDAEKRKKFDAGEIDADGRETMRGFGGGNPFGQGGGFRRRSRRRAVRGRRPRRHPGRDVRRPRRPRRRLRRSRRGHDVRARVEIDLEDAINGAKRRIAFSDGRTLDVTIPKGAADGQVLRLKGQGAPGRAGAGRRADRAGDPAASDLPARGRQPGDGPAGLGARRGAGRQGRGADAGGPVTLTVPKAPTPARRCG